MMKFLVILLATAVLAVSAQVKLVDGSEDYVHTILVTGRSGDCKEEEGNITYCGSLHDVHSIAIRDSTDICVMTNSTALKTVIYFHELANISIIGVAESSTIVECEEKCAGEMGAGIHFLSVQDITIRNVTFKNCGLLHNSTTRNWTMDTTVLTRSALYLDNCVNVNLMSVHFVQSNGRGLTLFDTVGTVSISSSTFDSNNIKEWGEERLYPGGGGIYVEFTYCPPGEHAFCNSSTNSDNSNSSYLISQCNFTGNTASLLDTEIDSTPRARGTKFQGMGRGGGIGVFFKGQASKNTIHVEGCYFTENSALWGGAFYVVLQDSAKDNSVFVEHSEFHSNRATGEGASGGGAVDIGLIFFDSDNPVGNFIRFYDCQFIENSASCAYGGAVGIFSSQTMLCGSFQNTQLFERCSWRKNKAHFGAAVAISPDIWNTLSTGFLPKVTFKDCELSSNYAVPIPGKINQTQVEEYFPGMGVFMVTGFPVEFEGESIFTDNNGTALYQSDNFQGQQ